LGTDPARSAEKKFLVVLLYFFGSKSTISRFGECYREKQLKRAYSIIIVIIIVIIIITP